MKLEMDTIVFESRQEIWEVATALREYIERHPNEKEHTAKELYEKLDIMDMTW